MLLLAGTASAGPADTKIEIDQARKRLSALEAQMSSERARLMSMNEALKELAGEVAQNKRVLGTIQGRLARTQALRVQTVAELATLQERIDRAAAEAYVRGPGYVVETIMHMDSLSDASDALAYASAISSKNAQLADEAAHLQHELEMREKQESALVSERNAMLARLNKAQDSLVAQFAEQQVRLGNLARAGAEVRSLLAQLADRLRAEEIAAARAALERGTPMTFGDWATAFLGHIRAPVARNNLVVIVAWEVAEYTQARWNPLATTYPMPGATTYNGSGVKNYVSLDQGLQATRRTLGHCCYGYEAILANLARNADPMTTGQAIHDSRWCAGCAHGGYVIDIIPTVERYYDHYAEQSASE